MTRLAPSPAIQAELMCAELGFNMKNIPLCERLLAAWEMAIKTEIQTRILPDEENAEVLGCSGEETRQ